MAENEKSGDEDRAASTNEENETTEKKMRFWGLGNFEKLVRKMYEPRDPSSLAVTRILFGLLMMQDVIEERGGSDIDLRWGEPRDCHFPLFPALQPLAYPHMSLVYGLMFFGALGITLGYKFRLSVLTFCIPYWYILLLDKSYWNNHSYLFGLVAILLIGSCANHFCSVDSLTDQSKTNAHVPYWNYFILQFQFFLLYFYAGLKKMDMEWLDGYSMTNLGTHWIFMPFELLLTTEQIDYFVVHWFGFILDISMGFCLFADLTRRFAVISCLAFHYMNSKLFDIGVFPYVCIATISLFYHNTWPKDLLSKWFKIEEASPSKSCVYPKDPITWKHRLVAGLLVTHCGLQCFLPYSHFVTKGYNNWTNGLYGYSWDMMIHAWDTILVVVKVVDNGTGREHFLDPGAWTQNDRWSKHGDMCVQYAQCVKENLLLDLKYQISAPKKSAISEYITSENISIYVDVWTSLNGRFQQRMFDPNYDLLKANWSPWRPVEWLLPLLTDYNEFRDKMTKIQEEIYSWSNYSDVLFIADFPGLHLENYVTGDLRNITLTVLEGEVYYEPAVGNSMSFGLKLPKSHSHPITSDTFHKIHTIGTKPSCYMYTYINGTKEDLNEDDSRRMESDESLLHAMLPYFFPDYMNEKVANFVRMLEHFRDAFLNVLYNTPMTRRVKIL